LDRCQITASTSPSSFTASGGSGTLTLTTTRDCTWTVTSNASWVSIVGPASGQGQAAVQYTVAANTVPSPRSGAVVVGSDQVAISQAAAPCSFSLSRSGDSIGAAGGRLSVDVTALSGCAWTATSNASWISIVGGQSGNASGTVQLSVAANTGAARTGQVSVGGQGYSVSQAAAAPTPPPPPPQPPPVHVQGSIATLTGSCPNLTFTVKPQTVVTTASTKFVNGTCSNLRVGRAVTVDGVTINGVVQASSVQLQ
jgi:hypothetical protein